MRPFFYALKMGEALGNRTTVWSGRPSFAMRLPPRIRHKKRPVVLRPPAQNIFDADEDAYATWSQGAVCVPRVT